MPHRINHSPSMAPMPSGPNVTPPHGQKAFAEWKKLASILRERVVPLHGDSLGIASLVAVSRYGVIVSLEGLPSGTIHRISESVRLLREALLKGESIYGVNTGFGGNANTHTDSWNELQTSLIQMQLSGILPVLAANEALDETSLRRKILRGDDFANLTMPESWVRGTMAVRCNSLLRGHSAVRLDVIDKLVKLLMEDVVPQVPLRGSISASGDLCPLAYVVGLLEGNPDVKVWTGPYDSRRLVSADVALRQMNMQPVRFEPKESLGILNGTAASVTVAALAQHQADNLAVFAQVLTAMAVEALHGSPDNFHTFIGDVRPHPGQLEVAQNIKLFLEGSKLTRKEAGQAIDDHLRQDRYALRTAAQWIGPYLEDLKLAREQLDVELNSTTDNPLFDTTGGLLGVRTSRIHHGGNFQAAVVTSSTEKTRLALQMIGKLIFAQSSELLDVQLNDGLPPNLAADEPSLSFTLKGVDINMAAYMSELAVLANPVSSHVQSAEMSNQSVNSLALISARYTHQAVDVLSLMMSANLYSLCQALDLRVMNAKFLENLRPRLESLTEAIFSGILSKGLLTEVQGKIWTKIAQRISQTAKKDSSERFDLVARPAQHIMFDAFLNAQRANMLSDNVEYMVLIGDWTSSVASTAKSTFDSIRTAYMARPDATSYLGAASKRMYKFVREGLKVPFHRGLRDHPTGYLTAVTEAGEDRRKNTGSFISIIYEALRNERLIVPVMECLEENLEETLGIEVHLDHDDIIRIYGEQ